MVSLLVTLWGAPQELADVRAARKAEIGAVSANGLGDGIDCASESSEDSEDFQPC